MEEITSILAAIGVMRKNVDQLRERMKSAEGDLDLLDNAQELFVSLQQEINFLGELFESKYAEAKLHNNIKSSVLEILGGALKQAADKDAMPNTAFTPVNDVGKPTKAVLKSFLLSMAESIDDT